MYWEQHLVCFDLDDYKVLNQQIDAVGSFHQNAFIPKRRCYLPLKTDRPLAHFIAKALFVCRFQKSGPQMTVNLDGSPNYALCNLVFHSARSLRSQRLCVEKISPLLPRRRFSLQHHFQNIVLPQLVALGMEVQQDSMPQHRDI